MAMGSTSYTSQQGLDTMSKVPTVLHVHIKAQGCELAKHIQGKYSVPTGPAHAYATVLLLGYL